MPSLTSCCRALDLPTMPSLSMHRKHQVVRRRDDGVLDMMMATCRRGNGGGRDVQAGDPGRTKSQSVEGRSPKITTTSTRARCVRLWQAWIPAEVGQRMASVAAPWYVAAGRPCVWTPAHGPHDDVEIGVPRARFGEIVAAFPDFEWDVVGGGRIWPFPEQAARHHQTWLRETRDRTVSCRRVS